MKTAKLYYDDAFLREFEAEVVSCGETDGGFAVVLDRTAFFPEEGGQTADTGTLGGVRVLDVRERDGVIVHLTDGPLSPGNTVAGALDWAERFRKMQNHTAEHIVSGLAHARYGCDNVGFHLGADGCTFDLNIELTRPQLDELEDAANAVVWDDRAVTARFPTPDELKSLDYRAKLALTEGVRIVTVEGVDNCACCAPHVRRTGQLGAVKLLDFMRHRGGVRIWLKAGADALADYRARYAATAAVSALLNTPQADIAAGTERLIAQRDGLRAELDGYVRRALEERAAALEPTAGNMTLYCDADDAGMRVLANAGMEKCGGVCAVFSGSDGAYRFVMGSRTRDMRTFAKEIREPLRARGGGQERMISGKCEATRAEIEAYFG